MKHTQTCSRHYTFSDVSLQGGCWQGHQSSVIAFASRQVSLQNCFPSAGIQLQGGCEQVVFIIDLLGHREHGLALACSTRMTYSEVAFRSVLLIPSDVYVLLWSDPRFPHRTEYDFRIQEGAERCRGLYIDFYNTRRPHSSLKALTPDQVYFNRLPAIVAA